MTGIIMNETLQALTEQREGWCVSIYMPTIEKSQQVRQNPTRYKNLLNEAEQKLSEAGLAKREIDPFLAPARELQDDGDFWQHQSSGLAVFVADDFIETVQLPETVDENVVVAERFHLKPLLPLIQGEIEFFILAVTQKQVRFLRATQYSVKIVDVPNLPSSMKEALNEDTPEEQLQWHTQTSEPTGKGIGGERAAMFHGHGGGDEDRDQRLVEFFRMVNKAVTGYLKDSKSPLLLAGVAYFLPLYKQANTYQHLMDDIISGSPKLAENEQLRDEAWEKVRPLYQSNREEFRGQYKMLAGRQDQRAVKDLKEVVKAAPYGRVEVLFVDKNAKQWGSFDSEMVDVQLDEDYRPGAEDLLDFVALQTLMNGGTVYAVDGADLPEIDSPVAAIFRY